jgi:hypothetical protein
MKGAIKNPSWLTESITPKPVADILLGSIYEMYRKTDVKTIAMLFEIYFLLCNW